MKGKAVIVAESLETGARLENTVRSAGYRVVGRFISPRALLEAAKAQAKKRTGAWDLVLMEICGSDWNGVEGGVQLRKILPEIPILLFTSFVPAEEYAPDQDLEDGDVSLPPAAWEMLCRLRSMTAASREPGGPTAKSRRPSRFDLARLIHKKKRP